MKNYADLEGCYPPWPSASIDNILRDLHNSSHSTKAKLGSNSIIFLNYVVNLQSIIFILSSFDKRALVNAQKSFLFIIVNFPFLCKTE